MTRRLSLSFALPLVLLASPALAHVGYHSAMSFADGVLHPLNGVDHLLAAFAVGLWASLAGNRQPLVWPLTFVGVMTLAVIAGANGAAMPFMEVAIALSVAALGALIVFAVRAPLAIGAVAIALFAAVHGYAHGVEGGASMPYLAGLVAMTAALHIAGYGFGYLTLRAGRPLLARVAGGAIAAAGVALLVV
jgi:urease accessory protein